MTTPNTNAEQAADLLEEIKRLLELRGESTFRIRAYDRAIQCVRSCPDLLERARAGTLAELDGIGKGISETLREFLLEGRSTIKDELSASFPPGFLELVSLPGLGAKKAQQLIDALDVHSLADLETACRSGRIAGVPGFGAKMTEKLLQALAFRKATASWVRLDEGRRYAGLLGEHLEARNPGLHLLEAGALRRRCEILSEIDFLVVGPNRPELQEEATRFLRSAGCRIPARVFFCSEEESGGAWIRATGSDAHWAALQSLGQAQGPAASEEEFYARLGLAWIGPECRETGEEVELSRRGELATLVTGVRGFFHCHTTWSDGHGTVEEMVRAARDRGLGYIGISDHSQSAFYARGLRFEALESQFREIENVRRLFPEITVFWGIESDILEDGSLDYPDEILRRFDFVVASIHSRFKMGREQMTERVLRAIQNPYTRFLGHPTGRLLLEREPYELDMERVIAEAAKNGVAIELNAHPTRLDIDWRWGTALRRAGALISINPDAHDPAGIGHIDGGVVSARKALLPASAVLNSREVSEVGRWLRREIQ